MRFLRARGRLIEPQPEDRFASLRREYDQYLVELRGLSPSARSHHAHTVADFLCAVSASGSLSTLTQRDVEAFVVLRGRRSRATRCSTRSARCARFCSFATTADTHSRLDQTIDTPRTYRGELPPRALAWRTVQALLASIDRASKRLARLLHSPSDRALRAWPSEVVSLRLDSIDWERCILRVTQHKTRSALTLPLVPATMRVLRQYLAVDRERRGSTHSELFLRARCPNGPTAAHCGRRYFREAHASREARCTRAMPTAFGTPSRCISSREASA